MDQAQVRFFDSILTPWRALVDIVATQPIAANPESNKLTVAADALAISLRHFKERHLDSSASKVWISDRLCNWADSVKHATETGRKKNGQDYREETLACYIAPTYEHLNGSFRFIRNEIICAYPFATGLNAGKEFLALDELWLAMNNYATALDLNIAAFAPRESGYDFLPVAVAFNIPEYAIYTKHVRLRFLNKLRDQLEPVDPPDVSFVVLDGDYIGADLSKLNWQAFKAKQKI